MNQLSKRPTYWDKHWLDIVIIALFLIATGACSFAAYDLGYKVGATDNLKKSDNYTVRVDIDGLGKAWVTIDTMYSYKKGDTIDVIKLYTGKNFAERPWQFSQEEPKNYIYKNNSYGVLSGIAVIDSVYLNQ